LSNHLNLQSCPNHEEEISEFRGVTKLEGVVI